MSKNNFQNRISLEEKISSPSAGLLARNLRASVAGAHPVPCWKSPAGFSHPRNPKISSISPALIAPGETNFLLLDKLLLAESPQPEAASGRARPIGKMGGAGPSSEADSNRYLISIGTSSQTLDSPFSLHLKNPGSQLDPPATVGRTSAGGGRFCFYRKDRCEE